MALPLPHHTVSATWYNVRLTCGNFNFFFLNYKKKIKNLKNLKKIKKKVKKTTADTWHIISTFIGQLTEMNQLQQIFENRTQLSQIKMGGPT